MEPEEILLEAEEQMEKAASHLHGELRRVRTGRANPGMIEGIKVDYYGAPTPLKQLATISTPDPSMLIIKPFDSSCIGDVEKAILVADIGITPQSDGTLVRLLVPKPSQETRKKLAASVKERAETAKVTIRNARRDANRLADQAKKDGLPEDEHKKLVDEIQKLTKKYEGKVETQADEKTKEVLET
ncbi:MAG: ribosome recycling factor [Planctomycetes bacterium]|nr:ribosome recycling factor [Planctomycetota bacterium]